MQVNEQTVVSGGKAEGFANYYRRHSRGFTVTIILASVILVYIICNAVLDNRFLTLQNLNLMFMHSVIPCFLAWGISVGFTLRLMDLSVGAITLLACTVGAYGGLALGYPGLILGAVIVSSGLLFNYFIFVKTKIPSWIAGLGLTLLYEAIMAFYSKARLNQGMQVINLGKVCRDLLNPPYSYILLALGFVLAYIIFNRMNIGMNIKAVGSNEKIAQMMGINTKRTIYLGALIAGLFIGLSAAVKISYSGHVPATTGLGSISALFQSMAAFLLAQSIKRIINLTVGILLSTYFVSSIFTVLTMLGVQSGTFQEVALGLIVIICGIMAQRGVKGVVK